MSKLFENIRVALGSLLANKLRGILTILGIGIGIAAVTVLISLGQAVQAYVNKQLSGVGADLITVRPGSGTMGGGPGRVSAAANSLTEKDVALLSDPFNVPNIAAVVPVVSVSDTTDYQTNTVTTSVTGTTAMYFSIQSRTVASGRLFDDQDEQSNARVAVLGQTTVKNLFPNGENPLNETIRINDVPFRVIGTLKKSGGSGGMDQDSLIVVPITAAQAKLQTGRSVSGQLPVSSIYLKAANTRSIDGIVKTATTLLHDAHKIKPNEDNDFQVTAQKDMLASLNSIISILTIFLGAIGGISLLVGGIGVMNIMLVTVTERTREIGLRKAVGARGSDVLLQFLTEAIVLCLVGGIAGLLVATLFTLVIRLVVPTLEATVSMQAVMLAVGITSLVGIFFGLYPASRAASLSPISALRFE